MISSGFYFKLYTHACLYGVDLICSGSTQHEGSVKTEIVQDNKEQCESRGAKLHMEIAVIQVQVSPLHFIKIVRIMLL